MICSGVVPAIAGVSFGLRPSFFSARCGGNPGRSFVPFLARVSCSFHPLRLPPGRFAGEA